MSKDLHFDSQVEADSFLLDRSIARFKESARVTRSRAKHLTMLEQHRDALRAPVYRLPDEILAEIFKTGAMELIEGEFLPNMKFCLKVSWVVSRWRRVALGTPALWSAVMITLPLDTLKREKWTTLFERTRASSYLLSLCIELSLSITVFPLDYQPLVLVEVLCRCQILVLRGQKFPLHPPHATVMAPSDTTISFNSLIYLHLSHVWFPTLSSFIDVLRLLPCLVTLRVESVTIDEASPSETYVVQLERLERLAVDYLILGDSHDSHTPLQCFRTPRLKKLLLEGWDGVFTPEMDFSTITWLALKGDRMVCQAGLVQLICSLPYLTQLNIDLVVEDPNPYFLTHASVPPLAHIDFSFSDGVDLLSRWLVERTDGQASRMSLKSISLRGDTRPEDRAIKPDTLEWIRARGIEVILETRFSSLDWDVL